MSNKMVVHPLTGKPLRVRQKSEEGDPATKYVKIEGKWVSSENGAMSNRNVVHPLTRKPRRVRHNIACGCAALRDA